MPFSAIATAIAVSTAPARMIGSMPNRRISVPVTNPGAYMPDDMPFDDERRRAERMAAEAHRDRRRRHQQVHQAVAQRAGEDGDDECRLAHDPRERASSARAFLVRRRRNAHVRLHRSATTRERRHHHERAQKRRREEIPRERARLRPDQGRRRRRRPARAKSLSRDPPAPRLPPRRSGIAGRRRCRCR